MSTPAPHPQAHPHPSPSPAPAKARPAPPAHPTAPVNSGTETCPLKAKHPCDVQKLELVTTVVNDETKTCKLATTKKLRGSPTPGIKDHEIVELLQRYDLVQDGIGGYPSREDAHPRELTKIKAHSEIIGRSCSTAEHPLLVVKPLTHASEVPPAGIMKKGQDWGPEELYANGVSLDVGVGGSGIMVLFELIRSIWPLYKPKLLEIRAASCGVRPAGAGGAPIHDLVALLRVFRNDQWIFGIKIPPLGEYKHQRSATVTGLRETKRETEYSGGFGHWQGKDERSTSGTGVLQNSEHKRTTFAGSEGRQTTHSREVENGSVHTRTTKQTGAHGVAMDKEDGHVKLSKLHGELEREGRFSLVLKRNDRDWSKVLGGPHKDLKTMIFEGLEKGLQAIEKAIELFNKMPQLGWKFTFNVAILEGTIGLEWAPKLKEAPVLDRYWPVEIEVCGAFDLEVINLSIELSFGLDARALGSGVVAKISGSMGIKVPLSCEVTINHLRPKVEILLKPQASVALTAVGYASALGWSIIDAQLSVSAALIMPDGKLEVSLHHGVELKGTLMTTPIQLKGYYKGPFGGLHQLKPVQILRGYELYKFH
jgi:hypothetical protein